ncbi:hypothetical protein ABZP36_023466 [Zizania latifolia]
MMNTWNNTEIVVRFFLHCKRRTAMDAPSAAAAGGQPNPPPPPPLPQAETTNTAGGDATPPPPPQTEMAGSSTSKPEETFNVEQLSATSKAPHQEGDVSKEASSAQEEDGGKDKPAPSRWRRVVRPVFWVWWSLRRKSSTPSGKAGAPLPDTGDVAGDGDVPAKDEGNGKGEGSKSGRDEAQEGFGVKPAPAATGADEQPLDTKAEGSVPQELFGVEPTSPATGVEEPLQEKVLGQPQPPSAPASKPPPPPETTQERMHEDDAAKETSSAHEEDGGKDKPAPSRWRRLVRPVIWVLSLRRKDSTPSGKAGAPLPDTGDVAGDGDVPAKEEGNGKDKGSKSGRDEAKAPAAPPERKETPPRCPRLVEKIKSLIRTESCVSGAGVEEGDGTPSSTSAVKPSPGPGGDNRPLKRFRKVFRAILFITILKSRRKSKDTRNERAADRGKGAGEADTPAASHGDEKKPEPVPGQGEQQKPVKQHPKWAKLEEQRLETILEEAFTKPIAADFSRLNVQKQKRLLTFSVFPVGHDVKKQAVTYWWDAQYLWRDETKPSDGAGGADIFAELCNTGFLEPIKNRCSGGLQGCYVNPLVHWMLKKKARDGFVALDGRGKPADRQLKSDVFCLTESNRALLQKIGWSDDSQAGKMPGPTPAKGPPSSSRRAEGQQDDKTKAELQVEQDKALAQLVELMDINKIEAILNISAHVYRLPDCVFPRLGDTLVVLQLGRWWNSDGDTYMEVAGLETLGTIGNFKNLRYLGIRGLSNLTKLPKEVGHLQQLVVLDVRGCQNLASVSFSAASSKLRRLTHLDLTECYMLEHIGREMIASLSELKVFKGFVFSTNAGRRGKACRLRDLGSKMKNLQKLSINVTSDANVDDNEMAQLRFLVGLRKLTVTWGELPSIMESKNKTKQREKLLRSWTNLKLPPLLEKLDVRCYPEKDLSTLRMFEKGSHDKLTKLYVRGGQLETLHVPTANKIKILRLRYLKHFKTGWEEIKAMMTNLHHVEVVVKDTTVMKYERRYQVIDKMVKDPSDGVKPADKAKEEERELMTRMKISDNILDEHGAWESDKSKAQESNEASSKTLQEKDSPKIDATTNNDVVGVSSVTPDMAEKVQESNEALSTKLQEKDSPEIEATANNNVVGVSSVTPDMAEKGETVIIHIFFYNTKAFNSKLLFTKRLYF